MKASDPEGVEALGRLAHAIRATRAAAGVTQEDAAHEAGLSVRHYQELESGRLNASYLTLRSVAAALGTTVADIARNAERPSRRR